MSTTDYAWYAIRNTVYAFGSRIYLSRHDNYSNAVAISLKFFGNAISVQTEMLHYHTTLLAVRALILMVLIPKDYILSCMKT